VNWQTFFCTTINQKSKPRGNKKKYFCLKVKKYWMSVRFQSDNQRWSMLGKREVSCYQLQKAKKVNHATSKLLHLNRIHFECVFPSLALYDQFTNHGVKKSKG
jgi:hypothetical protein